MTSGVRSLTNFTENLSPLGPRPAENHQGKPWYRTQNKARRANFLMIGYCLLSEKFCVDRRNRRGGLIGGAAGCCRLHAGFPGVTPSEIAHVPLAVRQRGRIDARNVRDFQNIHRSARFGVTADAIGVEKEAFGRIGDRIENLFGLIGWRWWSGEDRERRDTAAYGNR